MTSPLDDVVYRWIEANIGEVVTFDRQHRWRPAWFVIARRQGKPVRLYVRGNRDGFGVMGVTREAAILQVLNAHAIPVPHIYGEVDGGQAIVMDWLPGEADLSGADSAEVDAVMDSYVDALVRAHRIEPAAFERLGMAVPPTSDAVALDYFETFVTRYREFKRRPEPLLEFGIAWLRRNTPQARSEPAFVVGDSGQFMFADRRITGILDVELAHIGDVSHDLAGLRLRNATEPMGDLGRVLRHYERVSEKPLDFEAIEFHTAKFALCTPLGLVTALHLDLPLPEVLQYIEWFHQLSLHAIESIARQAGVPLDAVSLPRPSRSRYSGVIGALPNMIESLDVPAGVAQYQRFTVASVARFCERVDLFQNGIVAADLDDMHAMLGLSANDERSGDAALEAFISDAGPEHDRVLIRLLHRRVMRQMLLLEPVLTAAGGIGHLRSLPEILTP